MNALDWIVIGLYLVFALGLGMVMGRHGSKTMLEFFVSGRELPWWLAGTGMAAAVFSIDTPLYVTGVVARQGVAGNWQWWSFAIAHLLLIYVFARLWRRAEVITDAELTEIRYGGNPAAILRGLRAVILTVPIHVIGLGYAMLAAKSVFVALGIASGLPAGPGGDPELSARGLRDHMDFFATGLEPLQDLGADVLSTIWGILFLFGLMFAAGGALMLRWREAAISAAVAIVSGLLLLRAPPRGRGARGAPPRRTPTPVATPMRSIRHTLESRRLRLLAFALLAGCAPGPPAGPAPKPAGLPPIPAVNGPLEIDVVAPGQNEALPTRDSTFIYGSVGTGAATLTINGTAVPVAPNGAFMAYLPVPANGVYQLQATSGGQTARVERRVRVPGGAPAPTSGARILPGTASPRGAWVALPDERVEVSFRGTPGGTATLLLPDGRRIPLAESAAIEEASAGAETFARNGEPAATAVRGVSTYQGFFGAVPLLSTDTSLGRPNLAALPTAGSFAAPSPADSAMRAGAEAPGSAALRAVRAATPATAAILQLVVGRDTARTALPLSIAVLPEGRPRVGAAYEPPGPDARGFVVARPGTSGPYHYLWPNGTRLTLTGERGDLYRVALGDGQGAWVDRDLVRLLPTGTPPPFTRVNTVRLNPAPGWVDVRMVVSDRVPFFVTVPDDRTLQIDLYGAVSNTNYFQYGELDPLIERAGWSQPADSVYRVTLHLTQPVWGYRTLWTSGGDLVLRVRRPPTIDPGAPFRGLKIALDPGHPPGGAVGPTRYTEPEANLGVALHLKPLLEREGATVLMTRTDMSPVPLNSRPLRAAQENADIFLSLHNNGLPPGVDPFTNTGTSAYYFHPFSEPLAVDLQRALLRELGLRDLGIGRADFALVRTPWFPSVLTETMFLMVPQQEAALRSPEGQERIARAHVEGLRAFLLSRAREQADLARR